MAFVSVRAGVFAVLGVAGAVLVVAGCGSSFDTSTPGGGDAATGDASSSGDGGSGGTDDSGSVTGSDGSTAIDAGNGDAGDDDGGLPGDGGVVPDAGDGDVTSTCTQDPLDYPDDSSWSPTISNTATTTIGKVSNGIEFKSTAASGIAYLTKSFSKVDVNTQSFALTAQFDGSGTMHQFARLSAGSAGGEIDLWWLASGELGYSTNSNKTVEAASVGGSGIHTVVVTVSGDGGGAKLVVDAINTYTVSFTTPLSGYPQVSIGVIGYGAVSGAANQADDTILDLSFCTP